MLILVINLARRPDRLAFVRSQLDALGIAFERIDAIDGKAMDLGPGTDLMTPVEHACALSHRKAWLRFLASDESHCLILEDDVFVAPQTKQVIEDPRGLPKSVEILRLETRLHPSLLGRGRRRGPPGFKAHPLLSTHHGSAAYIINRAFAERAVNHSIAFVEPLDDVLFNLTSSSYLPSITYQMRPGLCVQADLYEPAKGTAISRSDLETERDIRKSQLEPSHPHVAMKRKRSFPEKCLREVGRWWRKIRTTAEFLHVRFIVGRAWRDIPFAGRILPVAAAALAYPGSEQGAQPEVQALSIQATGR